MSGFIEKPFTHRAMSNRKLIYGVGINDADYPIVYQSLNKKRVYCPYYQRWRDMLKRCYSEKYLEESPTYKGCTVSKEWHTFSNFKAWMKKQDWEGMQLDKDLLLEGNKVYSAETCVFVSSVVNKFTIDSKAVRGEWLIGVYWNKGKEKFQAQCSNPATKKLENLGYFTCELEAHKAWANRKLELAHELAATQTDQRVAKALVDRYSR